MSADPIADELQNGLRSLAGQMMAAHAKEITALRAQIKRAADQAEDLRAENERLRARAEAAERQLAECWYALKPFCFGDPVMEKILWGKLPDDATGSVTVKLGDFRRARKVLEMQNQPIAECREKGRCLAVQ